MQGDQATGQLLVLHQIAGKQRRKRRTGQLSGDLAHRRLRDIEAAVIEGGSGQLGAGMFFTRMEQYHIARFQQTVQVLAGQGTVPILHQTHHIVFVEMRGKGLGNLLKSDGLNL